MSKLDATESRSVPCLGHLKLELSDLCRFIASHACETDQTQTFPAESMTALKHSGLMGLLVPTEYGGGGRGLRELADVSRLLAASCLNTAFVWAMHSQQIPLLVQYGSAELRDKVLPEIAAGSLLLGSVTSERETGGDLLRVHAPLDGVDGWYAFERKAPIVTAGEHADGYVMSMRRSAEAHESDGVFIFADQKSVSRETLGGWSAMGMRGTNSVPMRFTGRIKSSWLLDPRVRKHSFEQMITSVVTPVAAVALTACWLGAAEAVYNRCRAFLRHDRGAASRDLCSERLARARLDLEIVRASLEAVLRVDPDSGVPDERRAGLVSWQKLSPTMLKIIASERCFSAVDELVQLAGARLGYCVNDELPLERTFRDLRCASLLHSNDRLLGQLGAILPFESELAPNWPVTG